MRRRFRRQRGQEGGSALKVVVANIKFSVEEEVRSCKSIWLKIAVENYHPVHQVTAAVAVIGKVAPEAQARIGWQEKWPKRPRCSS